MALRPSQVETLRLVAEEQGECLEALGLAGRLGITPWSAWKRLDRLTRSGHLEVRPYASPQFLFYLTQLGKEALESSDGGEGR
jgi:predicted ArsR family transcriptional regulator